MFDYKLRFKDEKIAKLIIKTLPKRTGIVELGIHKIYDEEGNVIETLDGYHVDVRSRVELPELDKYKVSPKNPFHQIA